MPTPTASASAPAGGRDAALVRAVGTWGLAAGIVNVTIGGGIFRLPAGAADALGAAAPLAYVLCAVAMGLIVVCFAEAGSRVSLTGGLYAYVEVAFGPFLGFVTGVMLWASMSAALAAVSTFFADGLVALVPALGPGAGRAAALLLALAVLAWLNVRGVRGASRFNAVMTVAKLLPLAVFVALGAAAVSGANLAVERAPTTDALARGGAFLLFAFLGVEAALVPSGEVREPARTVPRALFVAMLAVTLVYLAVHVVTQGILGPALARSATPVADAAGAALGPAGRTMILVGSTISMFGYVSGMTLGVPRILYAFGRDGFLPAAFARIHPEFRTPHVAIVAQALLTAALALSGGFEQLALVANGAGLLAYAACVAAAWQLRRRDVRQGGGLPFRTPFGGVAPVLALLVIAFLLSGLTSREWVALAVVAGLSVPAFFLARRRAGVESAGVDEPGVDTA
ncbi:APC family permease [Roseisolibacter sp. H3M3-2]|uniref:APC family permease n=1 Tax=Roseisolibacter sp. H3M3-2 TaxID=3031323 RepID=UPI0023D9A5CC|nr:APC family permease [Roseisolibacter sp. H3M3-2]MDF1501739.1 APC family permease [Roseisolibacter sp. H3M3-2]